MILPDEENTLETIDWNDSQKIFAFGLETVRIASEYQSARAEYARNLKELKLALAGAYKVREIERKISEDKAYLILAEWNDQLRENLKNLIDAENEYKGLEKVLETRQAVISLAQSLIKNRMGNEV